jgi:hypothetical protein
MVVAAAAAAAAAAADTAEVVAAGGADAAVDEQQPAGDWTVLNFYHLVDLADPEEVSSSRDRGNAGAGAASLGMFKGTANLEEVNSASYQRGRSSSSSSYG